MRRTTRLAGVTGAAAIAAVLALGGTAGADDTPAGTNGTRVTATPDDSPWD